MRRVECHIVLCYAVLVLVFSFLFCQCISASIDSVQVKQRDFDTFFSMVMLYVGENEAADEYDVEMLYERLSDVYDVPMEWNSITRSQLEDLLFLPDELIENLLYYADVYGPVRSIRELVMVPGIESPMLRILPEILVVNDELDSVKWTDAFKYQAHKAFIRTDFLAEQRRGFLKSDAPYKGIPVRMLAQYRYSAGSNFRAGVALESDAGEPFVGGLARGFDLYRFCAQLSELPVVERVVFGSYKASFGHGLLFGDMSYGSKEYKLLNTTDARNSVVGYSGVSEAPSFFGVSASANIELKNRKELKVSALYSYSPLDADMANGVWHSVITTGYHRTFKELTRRGSLFLHTLGADISLRSRLFHVGITAYGGFFSLPAEPKSITSAAIDFYGDKQFGASLHYKFRGKGLRFSGETAVSGLGAMATVNELHISPASTSVVIVFEHRYIAQRYHQFWAKTSLVSGEVNAEHGGSVAMKFPVGKGAWITAFADVFLPLRSTSVTSNRDIGYETVLAFNALYRDIHAEAKLRYSTRPRWHHVETDKLSFPSTERVALLRCKLRYPVSTAVSFVTGWHANLAHSLPRHEQKPTFGCMVYHDVCYLPSKVPFSLRSRLAFNYSPTWDNRFYLYEYDVSAAGFSPAMYGVSLRWLLMLKYQLPKYFVLSARVAQSVYFDRDVISSGNDQINSNHRTDFHLSLSYLFNDAKIHRSRCSFHEIK